jgi:hypothetical protein
MLGIWLSYVAYLNVSLYIIKDKSFENVIKHLVYVTISPLRCSEIFLILKINVCNSLKNIYRPKQKIKLILNYFNEIEYPERIYGRFPNIKFNENSWCVGRVVPCGRSRSQGHTLQRSVSHTTKSVVLFYVRL